MKLVIFCALGLTLLTSSAGFAQGYDNSRSDRRGDAGRWERGDERDERTWSRGQRLPREYLQDRHVHRNWQESGLRRPPRGYQWMVIGRQFVLVARSGGRIAETMPIPRRGEGRGYGYGGDRNEQWRGRYKRAYTYNDDVAYTECRNQPDPAGVLAGAFLGGVLGNAAGSRGNKNGATFTGAIAGGVIGAALTAKLDCGDRSYVYKSYADGFNGGRTNTVYNWKNPQNNHRGEMRVIDYYNDEDRFRCAVFSQTRVDRSLSPAL